MVIGERELTADERQEWDRTVAETLKWPRLAIGSAQDTGHVLIRIHDTVEKVRGADRAIDGMDLMDIAFNLGTVWGEVVRKDLNWELLFVKFEDDEEGEGHIAIGPEDRSVICLPIDMMVTQLMEPDSDNSVLPLYTILKAGQLPAGVRPGQYIVIE